MKENITADPIQRSHKSFAVSRSWEQVPHSSYHHKVFQIGEALAAMSVPKQQSGTAAAELSVTIVACGPCSSAGGTLVYAITILQPVQSWTVVRSHEDFQDLGDALRRSNPDVASLVVPVLTEAANTSDPDTVLNARNDLQDWLSFVLLYPSTYEVPEVGNFLTVGANTIPPQYSDVSWTWMHQFTATTSQPVNTATQSYNSQSSESQQLDDMEMADMFPSHQEENNTPALNDDQDFDDEIPPASVRYKATDEAVTEADELELMQLADEVEMIEDIGSLAQSLGASHLGRSLQLQAALKNPNYKNRDERPTSSAITGQQRGLNITNSAADGTTRTSPHHEQTSPRGGIGSVMEQALKESDSHFNHRPPVSAPRLDSFKMIKVIGKGSFGKVFLVKEVKTGEIYALKVLRKDNIIKRNQVEHTNTERSVLGYVRHPFIVGMNMAFQSKDKLYFVLDYCAGGELFFQLGKCGRFPEYRARFYAAEIILAISYVHELDVIYRDLKPENVLLDAKGHIRLTDFGLSKEGISSSSSGANSFCGTPEYLAPEILNRQGHGRAVDWWSLGALLYEMITGLPPFYCQDRERLFDYIRNGTLEYPATVSKPAKRVLMGLLTKDPVRRLGSGPTDAEEIKEKQFFSEIDFDKLMKGEIAPPWVPPIDGNLDTSQFDKEFTTMPVFSPQSMQRTHGFSTAAISSTPDSNLFAGFTFTDRGSFLHRPPGARAGIN